MKAKNTIGKIYVSPMPIQGILKRFVEDFILQFENLTRMNINEIINKKINEIINVQLMIINVQNKARSA